MSSSNVIELQRTWLTANGLPDVQPHEVFASAVKPGPQQLPLFIVVMADSTAMLRPSPELTEGEFMSQTLDALRDGDWEAPFARLTEDQQDEIERERPGHALCCTPVMW